MNIFSILGAVEAPSDLWVNLINWVKGGVGNIGWSIILVTVLIKLVTTPLEFMVKLNTKKQTLVQQKCAPQLAKLQKKFGNDRQALQVQTNAIYKREGLNMGAGCIIMLINLILSMTIFFTFFSSLRKFSAYEAINQYETITAEYEVSYYNAFVNKYAGDEFNTKEDVVNWFSNYNQMAEGPEKAAKLNSISEHQAYATDAASKSAVAKWNESKKASSWFWVQNIWVADSTTLPFPNYASLTSLAGNTQYADYVTTNINEADYNRIASLIADNATRSANGYFILAVLAGLITFASQYISELHTRLKNKKARIIASSAKTENASSMKIMKIVMPVVMVIFVLTSTASFGLYILASNVASILFGELSTLIVDKMTKKKRLEVEEALEKEANRLIKKGYIKE